jgi:murein DD-endopeptidase MepM/ murein hydrolase activator NlpD
MEYSHPLYDGAIVTQDFGANATQFNGKGGHNGKDYGVKYGTPVKAVADGIVEFEGWGPVDYLKDPHWLVPGAGIRVVLDHGQGNPDSVYGHLSATTVNRNQFVKRGTVIGYVGNTGNVIPRPTIANPHAGAHLHFSMYPPNFDLNSPFYGAVNPDIYLSQKIKYLTITSETNVRTAPNSKAPLAPGFPEGIAKGATISAIGHVAGEEVTKGNNAWIKTKSGYFVWANNAGNDLSGLPQL